MKKTKKNRENKNKKKEPKTNSKTKSKKKRTNGYILYCKANREKAYENLHNASEMSPQPSEIVRELAYMWKNFLSEDERNEWKAKAKRFNK